MERYRQHLREKGHRRYAHGIQEAPLQISLGVEEETGEVGSNVDLHFGEDEGILSQL